MRIVAINTITDKIDQVWDLLSEHREELTTHKHIMELKPDLERYAALEQAGNLVSLALYDKDRIVGYSVSVVVKNIHYADLVYALNDVLFVGALYRGSSWGVKLIHETEKLCKLHGAKLMMWHGKPATAFSDMMPRLGYRVQDIMFSKEL